MTESRSLRVFLCHSSRENSVARELYRQLDTEEWLDVWFVEERLLPSQEWGPEIKKGVKNADALIVLISRNFDAEEKNSYPSWDFVREELHEKVLVLPLLLDEFDLPASMNTWESIIFYPKSKRKVVIQTIIKSLKTHAAQLDISIGKRSGKPVPEKSVQWTPFRWKQLDDGDFEKDTEPELSNSPISTSRQRFKKKLFQGVNHVFLWSASVATLLLLIVCGLTVNYLVKGGGTNSFTAPIVSRALTLVPLPAPTLGVGSVRVSPQDGMRMVYVPAGDFIMGSDDGADDEKPARSVNLDAYWIDQFEVTNRMYKACVDEGKCNPPDYSSAREWLNSELIPFIPLVEPTIIFYADVEFGNYPVSSITWDDASAYCTWVGRRLPTEA
ncbi:MAG TPA: SUMF1/EgtB/PvdO family nonheme iron enzyme, partial [Anaerolineales bacterium]|nr:SUMF1/EgtB/PvdO family nonheme iron enzyme [Anaerolineales bacterium]